MFISKKRFQEEIAKAKEEVANSIYKERELDDRFRYQNEDIRELRREVYDANKRVCELEKIVFGYKDDDKKENVDGVIAPINY